MVTLDWRPAENGWKPPKGWVRIRTVESHTGGEPLRLVIEGWPSIPGATMLAKRSYAKKHHDNLRRLIMREPRGHWDMYGAIITEPVTSGSDLGVLFMHNEGFSTMCGHGVIAVVTSLLDMNLVKLRGSRRTLRLDTPAGRVTAEPRMEGTYVKSVAFENVPSFVLARNQRVDVEELGSVRYDLAFGGAFYAYCDAKDLEVDLTPHESRRLVDVGMRVKRAVAKAARIQHPKDRDLGFLYGTIISKKVESPKADIRNVCVFADGQIDRSPTGTGVSGHVALEHLRGDLPIGRSIAVESIVGSVFRGTPVRETKVGRYDAVVPRIEGSAWTSGQNEFWLDPRDQFKKGFLVG
ncbi:MAG TPA: proline racemase family protein [Nitrososphaerales archaeon]|nr:proline racemase family protein [Nitrososphaerales archaeon]